MNSTFATKAIVLRVQPWNDVDSRVVFYTQEKGKLSLIARGTKKPSSKLIGHLQPFNLVDLMVVNGKRLSYAGGTANLDVYARLKQDLDKLESAGQTIGLFNRLIKGSQPDPEIFVLLQKYLKIIDQIEAEPLFYKLISKAMLLQLLCFLGYQPDLNLAKSEISFIYNTNQPALKVSNRAIQIINIIINNSLIEVIKQLKIDRRLAQQVNVIINNLVAVVLDN